MESINTGLRTARPESAIEPARIRKFRLELVKSIPRFPNDEKALLHMQQKHISSVLLDYVHWQARYVGTRPRRVEIEPVAKANPRWSAMAVAIEAFLEKVRRGVDLTPHLSLAPHTRGYALAAHSPGATIDDRWSDKDLLLTRMGYHHFHLGVNIEAAGYAERTNDLVFAEVSRDRFKVIATFNHAVFNQDSVERSRLIKLHNWIIFRGLPPDAGVLNAPVMSSGHSMHVYVYAARCTRLIEFVDPQLDDRVYVEGLYAQAKIQAPLKPKLEWKFNHLDLTIYDRGNMKAFCVQQAWN